MTIPFVDREIDTPFAVIFKRDRTRSVHGIA